VIEYCKVVYRKLKIEILIFLAILFVAVFFRFHHLDSLPPGLWPDEAANGVDALKALDSGDFKIFYLANNGREGLFINLQAFSISLLGPNPFALRVVSAIIGTLTILGLYLITKRLFNWETAAAASYFLAISFWHVNFSRIGFRAIMLPLIMVWGFYFLWRGLRNGHLKEFFMAGLIGSVGFYTYFSFRIVPFLALILFWNYWSYLKKDFTHAKYEFAKNQLLRGFALTMLVIIVVAIPLGIYFYSHPEDFLKREGRPISIFGQEQPLKELGASIIKTLAMFNFSGDYNQRHNIPGWPMLSLPVGVLFVVGFLRELNHWLRRKHGHFSTVHTFLFAWFFIMLLPGFLSTEAPHALRTIGVLPIVMIFAAKGFGWLIGLITKLHDITDPHLHTDKIMHKKESRLLVSLTIVAFLTSIGFIEYSRYFKIWAQDPGLDSAFTQKYLDIANYLNGYRYMPIYILVNEGDVLIDGVPNSAQTIKFLTQTDGSANSAVKGIFYIRPDQMSELKSWDKFILIPLADNPDLKKTMRSQFLMQPQDYKSFVVYQR